MISTGLSGSSPLARGLQFRTMPDGGTKGIIPARAGFTGRKEARDLAHAGSSPLARGLPLSLSLSVAAPEDHPRSRGVYCLAHYFYPVLNRIIPARAGFTSVPRDLHGSGRDHPRSRGVYRKSTGRGRRKYGSSPLARGLLARSPRARGANGIIPARAGFTFSLPFGCCDRADHPRSRGVYVGAASVAGRVPGSSPLARGLRHRRARRRVADRIIPARAGFTLWPPPGLCAPRDHPRSRGVYPSSWTSWRGPSGSSPLARGLPGGHDLRPPRLGIIPARAGFTHCFAPRLVLARDHPRSRGVYVDHLTAFPTVPGSSPLARGLQKHIPADKPWAGIIPARAGFTRVGRRRARAAAGSSPLARGLPMILGDIKPDYGIIPARAGFTEFGENFHDPD